MTKRILVTDGETRLALSIVRSLGRAGFRPFVCATSSRCVAGASRFAEREEVVPEPLTDPEGFAAAVLRLVREWKIDVVQPVSEPAHIALLGSREQFKGVVLPPCTLDSFLALTDKPRVLAAGRDVGIAVPEHTLLASPAAANDAVLPAFPVVIKPARSINHGALHKVAYADDQATLHSVLQKMAAQAFPVMVQRRILGYGAAVSVLRWNGKLVAAFAHRRIRENPPSGGASVVSESVALDTALVARSLALLERFGWNGVAMVEFKVDEATGEPWLMEVNPRFWGSLQLAVDAGVDFPRLFMRCMLGADVSPVTKYRVGRRLRHLWGDIDRLIARVRHSRAELSLPPNAPGRVRALVEFLIPRRGQRHEILRLGDMRPFLVETRSWFERRRERKKAVRVTRESGD